MAVGHDPEVESAAYLGGAMSRRRARRFEAHLLACDACWVEVSQARVGRSMAEASRELAPQALREQVRMVVAGASRAGRRRVGVRVTVGAFALALVVGAAVVVLAKPATLPLDRQPAAIAAAVADFRAARLPAGTPQAHPAPDLFVLGFALVGSGSGEVGGVAVDAFGYRDASGRRLTIYLSSGLFPEAIDAHVTDGSDGQWTATSSGVHVWCLEHPRPLLAVSDDSQALQEVSSALR